MRRNTRTRLFGLNKERDAIVAEVEDRILSGRVQAAWESNDQGLEYVLNEAAYFEMSRLEGSSKKRHRTQYEFWHNIALTVGREPEEHNAELLASLVQKYARDIIGNFNPMVYRLATRVLPFGLNAMLNAQGLRGVLRQFQRLGDRISIEGKVDLVRRLSRVGTLVLVPTHSSHMDSILIGWMLDEASLAPVTYGAGKNLFRAPLTAFFMRNLGAYKVDRRLRHSLYKEVLKTISQVLIERGFHSLFFPGGTRTRSGRVEEKLKLGLAGTALTAYTESLKSGQPQPVFIVPVTVNYHLVLEAETLITDFLRTDGQSRYMIEDDEFTDLGRVTRFALNMMSMDNPLTLRLGTPFDPFGNHVDDLGNSYDEQGRRVDPSRYVETDEGPDHDPIRDREYTKRLGEKIAASLKSNNVLFSVHLVSLAILEILKNQHQRWDVYNTIRFGRTAFVSREELDNWTSQLQSLARACAEEGRVCIGRSVRSLPPNELVDEACGYFSAYHTTPLARRRGNGIELGNLPLLLYYSNRARGYGLCQKLQKG